MINRAPSFELRQLRKRLSRVLTHPHGQHLLDPSVNLRRRRYGTSHGVGLLHRLGGPEGTYAVASTAPALFTALLRRHPAPPVVAGLRLKRLRLGDFSFQAKAAQRPRSPLRSRLARARARRDSFSACPRRGAIWVDGGESSEINHRVEEIAGADHGPPDCLRRSTVSRGKRVTESRVISPSLPRSAEPSCRPRRSRFFLLVA